MILGGARPGVGPAGAEVDRPGGHSQDTAGARENRGLSRLGRAALAYVERFGWAVFPVWWPRPGGDCACPSAARCPRPGKHPITPNGVHGASREPTQIVHWWSRYPEANVAVTLAGKAAADADRHQRRDGTGLAADGVAELAGLALPPTPTSLSGGGGVHMLYTVPPGVNLRPTAELAPGVELLSGPGRYIVAPPSLHQSGREYAWDASAHPLDLAVAPLPQWAVDAARATPPRTHERGDAPVTATILYALFERAGLPAHILDDDKAAVVCPWRDGHTTGADGDTSTVIFAARAGSGMGGFLCLHAHCQGRTVAEVRARLAWLGAEEEVQRWARSSH